MERMSISGIEYLSRMDIGHAIHDKKRKPFVLACERRPVSVLSLKNRQYPNI